MTQCCNRCNQGRTVCPCPAACNLPEQDDDYPQQLSSAIFGAVLILILLVAFYAVVCQFAELPL